MSDFQLTESGDLDMQGIGFKDIQLVTDKKEALRQRLTIKLRNFINDWFLNLDDGISYFEDILKKNPNLVIVEAIFKSEILSTPGVLALTSFALDFSNAARTLSVTFTARTSEGELDITVEVPQ